MKKNIFHLKTKSPVSKLLSKLIHFRPSWKKFFFYSFYALIVVVFCVAIAFAWFAKDLPTPAKIANRHAAESTKIYDRTGQTLLYETGEQKRTSVESVQISPYLKDAEVSVEDANFFRHRGFDAKAIFVAMGEKVTGRRSVARGGSTITQQFVKNALLTSDRSLIRKFKELILAVELEFMYSKDQILTMYLNEIPYGNGTAGAEAAAKLYYGKTAKDLTLAQSATLAAIPKAPTYYSPYGTHTKELIIRKNYVLDRMVDTGKISKEDADKAKTEDTTTVGLVIKPRRDNMLAPHFAMYVMEEIAKQYGEEAVQKEGLKVITTLDYDKQKIAEQAVIDGAPKFSKYGAANSALVAVDPKTGQILAMVGSKDYFDQTIDGNVNVADSARQPGSSFKPFSYATAFKKKEYSPSKTLFDFQTDFGGGYIPQNYNGRFNGPITMRQALSNSLNIPAVKTMALAGMDNVIRTATDMGITTLTDRNRYGLSLGLGVAEVKPVEMASAFGVFANKGVRHDLTPVLKISDSKGKTLYEYNADKDKGRQALDPQIAYEISDILKDNNARALVFGTRSALAFSDRQVAAKTGTTTDFKDAWTVGFTPSISVAVWVGNSNAAKMSRGADGSIIAAPIFHQFIEKSLAGTPAEEFARPAGIQSMEVERFSNKLPNEFSRDKTTDIFASWQIPTEQDDVNAKVRICKANGKLAPNGLPENLVEIKAFSFVQSERPDNPNWENPVRAWAIANGFSNKPPTDYCSVSDQVPELRITSPASGESVSGEGQIIATGYNSTFTQVEFFIDNVSIGKVASASNSFTTIYNFNNLSLGTHKITVTGTDNSGILVTNSNSFSVDMTNISLVISSVGADTTDKTATIIWSTNVPATSRVIYGKNALDLNQTSSIISTLTTSHSVPLSGLDPDTLYYYKVESMDGSSNIENSEIKQFATKKH